MPYSIRLVEGRYRLYNHRKKKLLPPRYRTRGTAERVRRYLEAREERRAA